MLCVFIILLDISVAVIVIGNCNKVFIGNCNCNCNLVAVIAEVVGYLKMNSHFL